MNKVKEIIFSFLFGVALFSIPIIQLFTDVSSIKNLRATAIIIDTFYTPIKRAKNITNLHKRVSVFINKLREKQFISESDSLRIAIDSIESLATELKNNIIVINRFRSDSQNSKISLIDSMLKVLFNLELTTDSDSLKNITKKLLVLSEKIGEEISHIGHISLILRAFVKETFFSKEYLRKYEKDLENNSPIVKEGRKIIQFIRFLIFYDYGEKAIAGKKWLFYKPDVKYLYRPSVRDERAKKVDFNDESVKEDPLEAILDFKKQLDSHNIDLIVVIVPVKAGIYPQLLNNKIKEDNKYLISPTPLMVEELKRENIKVIDLYDAFLDAKKEDSFYGDSLYLCKDTHWKSRAIRLAAQKVAEEIKKYPWFADNNAKVEYTIDTVYVYRKGDIVSMMNFLEIELFSLREINKPELTKCIQVVYSESRDNGREVKNIYKDDFKNSRILLLGDSFSRIYQTDSPRGAGFVAHIAYELSEPLASIVSDGGASTIVREKLSRNRAILKGKKLIIWEFVERDLRFGEGGWKKVKIF
ncbi:MAG: hypothetical protein N2053_03915 [Chitinispirillaceae bacterium]|nr:hypothetical protein [Chitinispirillaceae bacterium]